MMKLSRDIENVANTSRISPADRETKVINLIGEYLSEVKLKSSSKNSSRREDIAKSDPSEASDFIKSLSSSRQYDKNKVQQYLEIITQKNNGSDKVSKSVISSIGNIRSDKNLYAAVRVYEEVGAENLTFERVDEAAEKAEASESRRFGGNYKYAGSKKYYFWYGWRYKCNRLYPNVNNGCRSGVRSSGHWVSYRRVDCWR